MEAKRRRCAKDESLGEFFRRIFSASNNVFYGGDTKFSYAACQWIEAESQKLGKHIHHKMCGHGGEREVMVVIENEKGEAKEYSYPVDGYEPEINTVYQYHGCKWHEHRCLGTRTNREVKRYWSTVALDGHIVRNGYNLVKVGECEEPEKSNMFFYWKFTSYPHFIVFDYEALMKALDLRKTCDLTYHSKHTPISVAIHDSLNAEPPTFIVNEEPKELTRLFSEELERRQALIVEEVEKMCPRPSDFKMLPKAVRVRWSDWVNQVPVFGFNSAKYDLNLIKEHLVSTVSADKVVKVAKKDNSYMFLTSSKFKFLDARNYIAPEQSIDVWCRSMDCAVQKLVFPYEWLDVYSKLEAAVDELVWEDFRSRLTNDDEKAKVDYETFVCESTLKSEDCRQCARC